MIESGTSGRWYYGYTGNLDQRIAFHNDGSNISTRNRGPWKYIFVREFPSKGEAIKFEQYLKSVRNKEFIRRAFSGFFV